MARPAVPTARVRTGRERRRSARPEGVETFAAACFKMDEEHPGKAVGAPRDNVLALFKPGTSPGAPARKLLVLVLHHAAVVWADKTKTWPSDKVFRFTKAQLRTSQHGSTDRLSATLADAGGIRLVTPGMLREQAQGRTYVAAFPRYSIAEAGEETAPVEIELSDEAARLVQTEEVFARLDQEDFLGLQGKVAVTLYQIGQLVVGLDGRQQIPIGQIRQRLGLRKDEYETAKDLRKLLERSAAEVSRESLAINLRVHAVKRVASAQRGPAAAIRAFIVTAEKKTLEQAMAAMAVKRKAREDAKRRRAEQAKGAAMHRNAASDGKDAAPGAADAALADARRLQTVRVTDAAERSEAKRRAAVARVERQEAERGRGRAAPAESDDL